MRNLIHICSLLAIFIFSVPSTATAYIDPGAGSAILSAIVGFFVALGLVVKTYWYKFKSLFAGKKSSDSETSIDDKE